MAHEDGIREAAIGWAVRTGDPRFDEWDAFTDWLARDPAHAEAYDRISADIADAAEADLPPLRTKPELAEQPASPARRRWLGGAIAASLAIVSLGVWQMQRDGGVIETAPGETRIVALADGGSVALGGGTRVRLDPADPRSATLEHGQALFTIHHDESSPFRLAVGGNSIVDVGTIFDVKRSGVTTSVAVAEGAVVFNPDHQKLHLDPGQILMIDDGATAYRLGDIAIDQVGEWRTGRLTFRDASLGEVADDLSRATGVTFKAGSAGRASRISGSMSTAAVRADPGAVGALLDVAVRREGDRWILDTR